MIRNLKALGLALVAMFAMGAVAASAASAQQGELTVEEKTVTLYGTETGPAGANALTAFGGSIVECPGTVYTGHKYNVTPHVAPESNTTTITITPHYSENCTANPGNRQATVETNGCDFVFHVGATKAPHEYALTADVECPDEAQIHVGVWSEGAANHNEGRLCTIEVEEQTGLTGTDPESATTPRLIHTTEGDDIDVTGTFEDIHVTRHGLCLLDGKGTTDNAGKFHIDATVIGTNAAGDPTGVTVTDTIG